MTTAGPDVEPASFRHEAFLYAGDEEFLRGTAEFVRDAHEADEPILVVVGATKIAALRDELGRDAESTHFADMSEVGHNPAWIIPAWQEFLAAHSEDGAAVRGIGEPIWPGRSDAEVAECQRHEELMNVAFTGGRPWWLLCPYDVAELEDDVIAAARRAHPFVLCDGAHHDCPDMVDLESMAAPYDGALPEPPPGAATLTFTTAEALSAVRDHVARCAEAAGMGPTETRSLVLAADEIATNSLRHGGGTGTLRTWPTSTGVVCEIRDAGTIADPLVGRRLPPAGRAGGRGVWIANHLCDLVQIRSNARGTTVRLHVHRV
ncbi:MAG TPA: sensor histidine kinase [Acidimicrobiia bacterium]|jgi:anti-sigma regulatory factor (Ser/Thr protein kinase)